MNKSLIHKTEHNQKNKRFMFSILTLLLILPLLSITSVIAQNRDRTLHLNEGEISPDELLLKDFSPRTQLVLTETPVQRAKFPVIDVHMHAKDRDAKEWEYGRQPNTARKFFIKYQDRLMFGTDLNPSVGVYLPHFRLLETDDDGIIPQGRSRGWTVYGLHLPDEVLRKIYYKNAERIIPGIKK